MVIPLTHHKNSGYTELEVLSVYLFVYRIFSWCDKGIVIFKKSPEHKRLSEIALMHEGSEYDDTV